MAMKGLNISGTEETIGKLAQRIVQGNLSEMEVKAKCKVLVESASSANPNTTRLANDDQKEKCLLRKNKGIDYPDYFVLESVKERLDGYDISSKPGLQALSDVMIMLCIRPAEVKSLRISDGRVTGYVKHRDQVDIPRTFRSMEKNEERARQLLKWIQDAISSGQLKIRIPGIKCFHALKEPRGVPYDRAKPFKLQTPTKTNHMAAHPGKSAERHGTSISAITKEIGALKKNASHLFNHCVDPQKYRVKINDKLSTNSSDSYDSSVSSEEQVPPHKR
ncbi:hypothetical protein RhiirC2_841260 [Rhizophagus irregularis]|uniref:Uncharacterized protein n=1 Tax=Rhizophagus irregularis TaxID=588596 RepID=A0A2N1P442_9GLOM|nr:hypothetical protein RhiirC2_841260 [Rhizophagus irregularis]